VIRLLPLLLLAGCGNVVWDDPPDWQEEAPGDADSTPDRPEDDAGGPEDASETAPDDAGGPEEAEGHDDGPWDEIGPPDGDGEVEGGGEGDGGEDGETEDDAGWGCGPICGSGASDGYGTPAGTVEFTVEDGYTYTVTWCGETTGTPDLVPNMIGVCTSLSRVSGCEATCDPIRTGIARFEVRTAMSDESTWCYTVTGGPCEEVD